MNHMVITYGGEAEGNIHLDLRQRQRASETQQRVRMSDLPLQKIKAQHMFIYPFTRGI